MLSPLFILCNSILGLAGVLLTGQKPAPSTTLYAIGALGGVAVGTAIGLRWMSEQATRLVLAAILRLAGFRLIFDKPCDAQAARLRPSQKSPFLSRASPFQKRSRPCENAGVG